MLTEEVDKSEGENASLDPKSSMFDMLQSTSKKMLISIHPHRERKDHRIPIFHRIKDNP